MSSASGLREVIASAVRMEGGGRQAWTFRVRLRAKPLVLCVQARRACGLRRGVAVDGLV